MIRLTPLILLVAVVGCGAQPSSPQPKVNRIGLWKVSSLTKADEQQLSEMRGGVERYLVDQHDRSMYKTVGGKLGLIHQLLQREPTRRSPDCLGVILGDAFVQELGMEWVIAESYQGRTYAVHLPGTEIILHPLSMMPKLTHPTKAVNVFDFFNQTVAEVKDVREDKQ